MSVFKLQKPKVEQTFSQLLKAMTSNPDINSYVRNINEPEYLFWDKARFRPFPKGMTPNEFWGVVKLMRRTFSGRENSVVRNENGEHFTWQPFSSLAFFLHKVDLELGGSIASSIPDDPSSRRRFITKGIIEEAIASSQLEGANTTRKAAKKMLLEKRKPINKSERMILNNYNAMLSVEENLKNKKLSIDLLFELHEIIVKDTVDISEIARLRKKDDEIAVIDRATNIIYHIPPNESFLEKELKRLIEYANDELVQDHFVHPLIKAIILHFWIGYLHPFTDGNGRLARTIFYWYLLRKGYWAFSYLPISRVIKNSPVQYRDAYVYSEQDDNDLTYFIDYIVRKIRQAKKEWDRYIQTQQKENVLMSRTARTKYGLNDRQIQVLKYLHKNEDATTTIKTHAQVYNVSWPTAQSDLKMLEQIGFLTSKKMGRSRPYRAANKTAELFE